MATALASPGMDLSVGGGDIFQELGETLNQAATDIDAGNLGVDDTPGGEAGSDPTLPTPTPEDTPGGESATGEGAKIDEPFPVDADGKNYIVPKGELTAWKGVQEYANQVQERFPTVADAEAAHMMSNDFRSIQYDFASGDPRNIDRMLNYWAGGNAMDQRTQQRYRESFAVMAERAPQLLQKINPEAHQRLSTTLAQPLIEQTIAKAYQAWHGESDPKTKIELLRNAQAAEYAFTGKYKTDAELAAYDPNPRPKVDPQTAEHQRREQDLQRREAQNFKRDFEAFDQQSMDGVKLAAVNAELDKVLAPIKDKYDAADFGEIRQGVLNELTQKIKSDQDWWANHLQEYQDLKREFQQCWRNGEDPAKVLGNRIQYYVNDLMVRARRALPSIAAPRITKATNLKVIAAQPKAKSTARPQTQQTMPPTATPEKNGGRYSLQDDSEFAGIFNAVRRSA